MPLMIMMMGYIEDCSVGRSSRHGVASYLLCWRCGRSVVHRTEIRKSNRRESSTGLRHGWSRVEVVAEWRWAPASDHQLHEITDQDLASRLHGQWKTSKRSCELGTHYPCPRAVFIGHGPWTRPWTPVVYTELYNAIF